MGSQKIRYLVAKRQKGGSVLYYWQPSRALREAGGFMTRRLAEKTGKLSDAIIEAEKLNAELDAWRAGETGLPIKSGTIPWLVKTYRSDVAYTRLGQKTQREYDLCIATIEKWSASVGHPQVAGIDRASVRRLARELAATPAKARAVLGMLRLLLNVAIEEGLITVNPAAAMRLPKPKARQTVWSDADIELFCRTAEAHDRASLALAVRLAANIGQRQGDILALSWTQFDGQHFRLKQKKTGKVVQVPASADLRDALQRAGRSSTAVVLAETTGRPYKGDHFRHEFARVCALAGLSGLWFMDLRRTAVVRLAEAGCTPPEISAITGHDLDATMAILEVYMPRTLPMATAAIDKLDAHRRRTKLEVGVPKAG